MLTTRTSWLSSATQEGLLDEVEKIAEELTPKDDETKRRIQKWLKNTAIRAGGAAAGQVAARGVEKALKSKMGPEWAKKVRTIGPAMGAITAGSALAAAYLANAKSEAERE